MEDRSRGGNDAVELFIPESVPLLAKATAADCAEAVIKGHQISQLGGMMTTMGAVIAGVGLARGKALCEHGEFGDWKKKNFTHIKPRMLAYYGEYTKIAFECAAKKQICNTVANFDFSAPETFALPAPGDREKWEALYKVIHEATDGKTVTGLLRAHGIIRDAQPKGGLRCERDADGNLVRSRRRTRAEIEHEQAVKESTLAGKALLRAIEKWHEGEFWNHIENADLLIDLKEELYDLHHKVAQSCAARKLRRGGSRTALDGKDGAQ